jgi:tRNA (cytidine/uridine-2'-O-)-methyltransferase
VYENYEDFLSKNTNGEFYYLTRYGKKPHSSFDFSNSDKNIYLVFGKESTGIPKEILKNHMDRCLRIPTNANIRALNLSNCVALVLFEVLRQQDYPNLSKVETIKGEDFLDT